QDVAPHGAHMTTCAIEEMACDPTFVLREGPQPAAGVDRLPPYPLLHGAVDDALQPAAMDRKLRHIVTGIDATRFAPDLLAMTIEIIKLVSANCDVVELLQQAEAGEFADRMRQGIDADPEFADGFRLFEEFAV